MGKGTIYRALPLVLAAVAIAAAAALVGDGGHAHMLVESVQWPPWPP